MNHAVAARLRRALRRVPERDESSSEPLRTYPLYSGRVMVPSSKSTWPERSSCTGPTRLGFVCAGGGPKYDGSTPAPIAALGGNRLHPAPRDSNGPGPGPDAACATGGRVPAATNAASGGAINRVSVFVVLRCPVMS